MGVTVNGAGRYTNNPNVDLRIVPPDAATGLLISNDGGFTRPFAAPLEPDRHYPWTLDSSGPERLPKTVYVRFAGACVDSSQTHQDDIILDETPPTLATPTVRAPAKGRRGALSLSLKATDNASGVRRVENPARQGANIRREVQAQDPPHWQPEQAHSPGQGRRGQQLPLEAGQGRPQGQNSLTRTPCACAARRATMARPEPRRSADRRATRDEVPPPLQRPTLPTLATRFADLAPLDSGPQLRSALIILG